MAFSKITNNKQTASRTGGAPDTNRTHINKVELTRKKLRSLILKLGLLAILIILVITMIVNQTQLSCLNITQCAKAAPLVSGSGGGYPTTVTGSKIFQTDVIAGNNIAVLTDNSFQVFNKNGKQAAVRSHFMSRPAMKTAGRYAALIDIGNKKYQLEGISDTIFKGTSDHSLISCAVSETGRFAIVTQGSSYNSAMLSSVDVFDHKGNSLHLWHTSDRYVTDVAMSADGKRIAMCGINASDGLMHSSIVIHEIGDDVPIAEMTCPNVMLYAVEFTGSDTLIAIGDSCMFVVSPDGSSCERHDFEGSLKSFDVDKDAGAAVFTTGVDGANRGVLSVYDEDGSERFSGEVPLEGTAVSLSQSGCCVLGHGALACYRLNGSRIGMWNISATPNDVLMIMRGAYLADGVSIDYHNLPSQSEKQSEKQNKK